MIPEGRTQCLKSETGRSSLYCRVQSRSLLEDCDSMLLLISALHIFNPSQRRPVRTCCPNEMGLAVAPTVEVVYEVIHNIGFGRKNVESIQGLVHSPPMLNLLNVCNGSAPFRCAIDGAEVVYTLVTFCCSKSSSFTTLSITLLLP